MELTTIAIGVASLIGFAHAFEWVKLRRMSPEDRRQYLKKIVGMPKNARD
jgi:hypothetical protein